MKWIQRYGEPGLSDEDMRDYLTRSYELVVVGLTRKARREFGLDRVDPR